ncbi:hypothetical protein RND71_032813 [Anisodus tanguticus]|uniref:Uncharacterized protein n=1 Tax=Anisodus tanguticus TaxID=243964 RepID=A0AAE1R866_9SOLA|nr:hypothetical protein RND71_032813 [Anisodus tanguticus]
MLMKNRPETEESNTFFPEFSDNHKQNIKYKKIEIFTRPESVFLKFSDNQQQTIKDNFCKIYPTRILARPDRNSDPTGKQCRIRETHLFPMQISDNQ